MYTLLWVWIAAFAAFGLIWSTTSEEEREIIGLIAKKDRQGVMKFARRYRIIDPFNSKVFWPTFDESFKIPFSLVGQLYSFLLRNENGEIDNEGVETVIHNLRQHDLHSQQYFINGLMSEDKELGKRVEKLV